MTRIPRPIPFVARLLPLLALVALLAQFVVGSALAPRALAAGGTTCVVTPQGTGRYPTIQSAVNDTSCSTIRLTAGTYYENVVINRDVNIVGLGPNLTTVNGGGNGTVFTINTGTVTLSGLTITNGSSTNFYGGGINNNGGTVTVSNSVISGNWGLIGGGIANYGSMTITNSTISGNSALYGGGIYNDASALTITNSTISGNSAETGGGILNDGGMPITVTNSTISGNTPDNCEGC